MSYLLTRLLTLLLYPLTLSLLLAALGAVLLVLRWRRSGRCALVLAFVWLYLCSTALFADFLMAQLERDYNSRSLSAVPAADAIVVLGGAMRGHTHKGTLADLNQRADRLLHAAVLFAADKAPLVLLSGGAAEGERPEAEQMRDILQVMGLPPEAMLLESRSRNTHENAVYSARLLRERGLSRVLLVTSAFHMRRAEAVFRARGLEVIPAPTDFQQLVAERRLPGWLPAASSLARSTSALHELAGYLVYRWLGRFDPSPALSPSPSAGPLPAAAG